MRFCFVLLASFLCSSISPLAGCVDNGICECSGRDLGIRSFRIPIFLMGVVLLMLGLAFLLL